MSKKQPEKKYSVVMNGRELQMLAKRYAQKTVKGIRHVEVVVVNQALDMEIHVTRNSKAGVFIPLARGLQASLSMLRDLTEE